VQGGGQVEGGAVSLGGLVVLWYTRWCPIVR
jgi:hypothetical protein